MHVLELVWIYIYVRLRLRGFWSFFYIVFNYREGGFRNPTNSYKPKGPLGWLLVFSIDHTGIAGVSCREMYGLVMNNKNGYIVHRHICMHVLSVYYNDSHEIPLFQEQMKQGGQKVKNNHWYDMKVSFIK